MQNTVQGAWRWTTIGGALLVAAVASGCPSQGPPPKPPEQPASGGSFDRVVRVDFNRLAAELALPLFWIADEGGDDVLAPTELAVLWGLVDTTRADWVADGEFTERFVQAYEQVVEREKQGAAAPAGATPAEAARRDLVRKELSQGRPTLLRSDFRDASPADRAVVGSIMKAARLIEQIHAKQRGAFGLAEQIPADDPASRMVLYRNQGPWCLAPATEQEDRCNAVPSFPKEISGLYPKSLQANPDFCDTLGARDDAEELLHQFVVVREQEGKLTPVPYTVEYQAEMSAIAEQLEQAALALGGGDEEAFTTYLMAAARAFRDNNWEAADEAWAKMNAQNSKWYLRIGPDEVYFEPCNRKAGFHVSFARINQDSIAWQTKLEPVKADMEKALAALAGPPYEAREVAFQLPDFIDIVLNAGDARSHLGATIGQSLPNWGPVANEGRGRTVAMTNLYTDPDSRKQLAELAASVLCSSTYENFTADSAPMTMSTVLHEAAHNLGPSHEYRVEGRKASEIFGGPLASTLEELKAQTSALYFTGWLGQRGIISKELVHQAHTRDMVWAMGHIALGMVDSSGRPKPYSQLAAIQLAYLLEAGAASWRADELAHNGKDRGCLALDLDKFPTAVERLLRDVAGIKAQGSKEAALALQRKYVLDSKADAEIRAIIRERWLRAPKASFVYSVGL